MLLCVLHLVEMVNKHENNRTSLGGCVEIISASSPHIPLLSVFGFLSGSAIGHPPPIGHRRKKKVFTAIASCIRKAFEKSYGRGWNVVVGRSFGAYVTHEIKTYMYFTVVPGVYVLLWR